MFASILENVRAKRPLVHNITNYVTANDCANLLLACGASPIMADDPLEAEEVTALSQGLHLNLGTLHSQTVPAMFASGRKANALGLPIVLDPVGAGVSAFRRETVQKLLDEIRFSAIRGNFSEFKALALGSESIRGVDAAAGDRITEENLDQAISFAEAFARQKNTVAAITGAIDLVTDGTKTFRIRNGHPAMSSVTGTGCQHSALTAAFVSANPERPLEATAAAVCAMGIAGETAYRRLSSLDGNASLRAYIIDAIYRLTPEQLEKEADWEIRRA